MHAKPELFGVKNGYAIMKLGSKLVNGRRQYVYEYVHRVLLNLLDGLDEDPSKSVACHTCDNPKCLNIKHLLWGNHSINRKARVVGCDKRALYSPLHARRLKRWNDRRALWRKVRKGVDGVCKRRKPRARRG